jgi:hypothetical protein
MIDREVGKAFAMEGGTIIPRKGLTELRKLLDQGGDAEVKLILDGQLRACCGRPRIASSATS